MSERRVDLIVPGPEGVWLSRALEQAGVSVRRRELDEAVTGTPALVVVSLALEVDATPRESFERQLGQARVGASPTTPLVALLPVDAQLDHSLRELAQGVYVRPVPVARLVHKIQTLLDTAEGRPPRASWAPSGPPAIAEPVVTPAPAGALQVVDEPAVRERTVRLEEAPALTPAAAAQAPSARSSRPPAVLASADLEPSSQVSGLVENTQPVAELSPWLHRMLSDCDRRMFPAAPPLDLRFPAGDDGPLELVPRALLDALGVPVDPAPGEGFDEHTFALDPLAASPANAKRHSEWPRLESSVGGGSSVGRVKTGAEGPSPGGSEPPSTREVVLPDAPRRDAAPHDPAVESVIARRPEEDTRRASRHAPPPSSAPPPPSAPAVHPATSPPRSGPPNSSASNSSAPNSSPPMSSAAGLYETAVEAVGFPPVPRFAAPPVSLRVGTPTADGRGRWGTLAPEAWMPFAEALRPLVGEQRVSLRSDGPSVLVHVRAGQVVVPDGALATASRAPGATPFADLASLRAERRVAREAVLAALTPVHAPAPGPNPGPEVVFEVYEVAPGEELAGGWPVGSLAGLLFDALVGWASAAWLCAHWRADLERVVRVDRASAPRLAALGLDPLWLEWLQARDRLRLCDLLHALPEHESLPAVLLALSSLDAFTLDQAPEQGAVEVAPLALHHAARDVVEGAYAATRDADYFTLLGVLPSASARAIQRASAERSAVLANLDLASLDLDELEPLRRDVLECYAEAERALRDDDARGRYARALSRFSRV